MRIVEIEWEQERAFLASLRDVTERKHAEDAIVREAEIDRIIARLSRVLLSDTSLDNLSQIMLKYGALEK